MFQKDMRIAMLLDFYKDILTDRQCEAVSLYYNDDLSLSEIAEITGISRQGVRDAVKRGVDELHLLERKLGLVARFEALRDEIGSISHELADASALCGDTALTDRLNSISKKLSDLNI